MMSKPSVIGVLGGMGPEATVNCFQKLLQNTPAACDQEHLEIVIVNNPTVPDRTRAILENGPSPVPTLLRGIDALQRAGADFTIIPCVTAHYFVRELVKKSAMPILSILDAVSDHIGRTHPNMTTIGLLGTSGTIQSGIFQKRLAAAGLEIRVCQADVQKKVMAAIYDIKADQPLRSAAAITADLADAAASLIQQGAQGIIAGCTEIPLALSQQEVSVPYFDSLSILARAAIRRAGREPLSQND